MWYDQMFEEVEQSGDAEQAEKMSAYMQNNFPFLGIPKPMLNNIIKPYMKHAKVDKVIDWDFVMLCWDKDYREAQYIGIEYLNGKRKLLKEEDINYLKSMIITKSWWETIDHIDAFVGIIAMKSVKVKEMLLDWSLSNNIWLRRIAIDYQQEYKENTDLDALETIIGNCLGTNEFYIDKAIGWSLREYSKVNPKWVTEFIQRHNNELAKLSIREASKYL